MRQSTTTQALTEAFNEMLLGLAGVFEVHDADAALVEDAADALGRVIRAHLDRVARGGDHHARGPLEKLLDDLQAAATEAT